MLRTDCCLELHSKEWPSNRMPITAAAYPERDTVGMTLR